MVSIVTTVPVVTVGGFGYTFDDVVTGQSSLTTGHMNLLDSLLRTVCCEIKRIVFERIADYGRKFEGGAKL